MHSQLRQGWWWDGQAGQESSGAGMMQAQGKGNAAVLAFGQGKASQHPG